MNKEAHDRRIRRRKETRAADLISAARDVFVKKGFTAARLDDVAAKAGVSKGTAYLYFETKEALFRAVVESGLAHIVEVARELDSHVKKSDRPAVDLLRQYFDACNRSAGEAAIGASLKLLVAECGNFPDVAFRFDRATVCLRSALLRIVESGIASGDFRPIQPDTVADLFLAVIWLSMVESLSGRKSSPDRPLGEVFEMLAHGLLRHPQAQPDSSPPCESRRP